MGFWRIVFTIILPPLGVLLGKGFGLGIYPQYRSDAAGLHSWFDPCLLDTDA